MNRGGCPEADEQVAETASKGREGSPFASFLFSPQELFKITEKKQTTQD